MEVSVCTNRAILAPCELKNIDYQVDTYIGCEHLCYYCYALEDAETDWSKKIQIHQNIVGQLSEELDTISPQTIYMGYQTDPYQPCGISPNTDGSGAPFKKRVFCQHSHKIRSRSTRH